MKIKFIISILLALNAITTLASEGKAAKKQEKTARREVAQNIRQKADTSPEFKAPELIIQGKQLDLYKALEHAYNKSKELKIGQQRFLNEAEVYPQALSSFMPRINAQVALRHDNNKQSAGVGDAKVKHNVLTKGVSIDQPLFNSGGSIAALNSSKHAVLVAKANLMKEEQEFFRKAIDTYLSYFEARKILEFSHIAVRSMAKRFNAVKEKFRLGEATRTEVGQARAALSKQQAALAAREAEFKAQEAVFKQLFGIEPKNIIFPEIPKDLPESFDVFLNKVLVTNYDLVASNNVVNQARYQSYAQASKLLPSAHLNLGASQEDRKTKSSGITNKTKAKSLSASVTLNIPILAEGGAEYSNLRKTQRQARQTIMQLEEVKEQLAIRALAAWENFTSTKLQLVYSKEQVDAQLLALRGIEKEESLGLKTHLDVLKEEEELYKARVEDVRVKKNYINSAFNLKLFIGDLTARALELKVKFFEPDYQFDRIKSRVIGTAPEIE